MELEQHRIVHESILKGKDLVIQVIIIAIVITIVVTIIFLLIIVITIIISISIDHSPLTLAYP